MTSNPPADLFSLPLQDALDKGVNAMGARSGHQMNAGTTEKVSDGIRTGFNKVRLDEALYQASLI